MSDQFDPYHKWLGIAPKDQPPHHYRLLGVDAFEDDLDVIDAAAIRILAYLKSLGLGDRAADSQRLMNEVTRASICLLDPESKAAYDEQLRIERRPAAAAPPKRVPAAAAAAPATPPPPPPPPVAPQPAAAPPDRRDEPAIALQATDPRGRHRRHESRRPSWQVPALIGILAIVALSMGAFALLLSGPTEPSRRVAQDTSPPLTTRQVTEQDDDVTAREDADPREDSPPSVSEDTGRDPDSLLEAAPPADLVSPQNAVDLLGPVDPVRHRIDGNWRREGTTLLVEVIGFSRAHLMIPFHPPAEYDLYAVIERETDSGHGCLGLVAGGRQFLVALDGRGEDETHVGGISLVDGQTSGENETTFTREVLPAGRRVQVVCRVRRDRLTVLCDGVPVIQWQDRWDRLSLDKGWAVPDPQALLIGTTRGKFTFHELRLVASPEAGPEETPRRDLATTEEIPPDVETPPPPGAAGADPAGVIDETLDRFLQMHDPIWKSAGFGLVAHWKFDQPAGDTAVDSVGSMNGRIHGASGTRGLIAGGLQFDSRAGNYGADRIEYPAVDFGARFTIAFWICPRPRDRHSVLVGNAYAGSTIKGFALKLHNRDRKSGWMQFQTGSGGPTNSFRTTGDVIAYGRWHHVALAVDRPSATARFYVDGQEVPSEGAIDPAFQTKADWLFGADPPTACGYLGLLDDFRIYNRVLSPGEVQNLRKLAAE